jgi:hypothetical protein
MKQNKDIQTILTRKINRQLELEAGRVSYNRIHKNKKLYNRKRDKKMVEKFGLY